MTCRLYNSQQFLRFFVHAEPHASVAPTCDVVFNMPNVLIVRATCPELSQVKIDASRGCEGMHQSKSANCNSDHRRLRRALLLPTVYRIRSQHGL
jgi:hypothetical protein